MSLPVKGQVVFVCLGVCSYACSWRRLNPCTDGFSGEAKDLWVFYFTDLPNITDKLSEELKGMCVCGRMGVLWVEIRGEMFTTLSVGEILSVVSAAASSCF